MRLQDKKIPAFRKAKRKAQAKIQAMLLLAGGRTLFTR